MLQFDLQVTGLDEAIKRMEELRVRDIPRVVKQIQWSIALKAKESALLMTDGNVVRSRSGDLRRHISMQKPVMEGSTVTWGLPVASGDAGLLSRIGAFLEKGGTVKPKPPHRLLRIPLPPAMTGKGVDRFSNQHLEGVPGFTVVKCNEKLFLARTVAKGRKGKLVDQLWYSLVPSAVVRAHPWFRRSIDRTQNYIPGIIQAQLDRLAKEGQS